MRGRGATIVAVVGMAALCAWFARFELIDDAYISFRYAENWLAGQGLVFNPGERVEGFTNFLWVALIAAGAALGVDPEWSSRALGGGFALLTVFVMADFAPRREGGWGIGNGLAPLLFAASLSPALWAVHGLETSLFTALLALGFRADLRGLGSGRSGWAAAWFALASLTRPEGPGFFVARLGVRALLERRTFARGALVRDLLVFTAIVGPFFLARLVYYGEALPNTFFAKAGGGPPPLERGLAYLGSFFLAWGSLLFAPLVPAARDALREPRIAYAWGLLAAGLAMVALEGGDAFPGFRFLVPVLPLLYFLVQEGVVAWHARWPRAAPAFGAALVVATALHVAHVAGFVGAEVRGGDAFTARMKRVGRALAVHVPPDTWIALNPVGALPYTSGLPAIDMLGITDRHIAHLTGELGGGVAGHEKGDGRYVLDRQPEIILLGNVWVVPRLPADPSRARWPLYGRSEHELARHPRLARDYAVDSLPLDDGSFLVFLRRRDFRVGER